MCPALAPHSNQLLLLGCAEPNAPSYPIRDVRFLSISAWEALRTYLQGLCALHDGDGTGAS
jgi:hypothetical protein